MKKHGRQKLMQIVSFLLCAGVSWVSSEAVASSEFRGGRLTGTLLTLQDIGLYLFLAGVLLAFLFRRVAAGTALIASLVSLPFYLYFVVPGLFRGLFKAEHSVPVRAIIVWNNWAVAGILTLALTVYVCLHSLLSGNAEGLPRQEAA